MAETKELTLEKNDEVFIFRYEHGGEENVLDAFVDMANDRANAFDWFDAAVLSFQLSKNLVNEADELLCPNPSAASSANGTPKPWSFP